MPVKTVTLRAWIGDVKGLLEDIAIVMDDYAAWQWTRFGIEVEEEAANWRWDGFICRVVGKDEFEDEWEEGWFGIASPFAWDSLKTAKRPASSAKMAAEARDAMQNAAYSYGAEVVWEGPQVMAFQVHPKAKHHEPIGGDMLGALRELLEERYAAKGMHHESQLYLHPLKERWHRGRAIIEDLQGPIGEMQTKLRGSTLMNPRDDTAHKQQLARRAKALAHRRAEWWAHSKGFGSVKEHQDALRRAAKSGKEFRGRHEFSTNPISHLIFETTHPATRMLQERLGDCIDFLTYKFVPARRGYEQGTWAVDLAPDVNVEVWLEDLLESLTNGGLGVVERRGNRIKLGP